jgi:FixJ family two-component response regulator
MPTRSNIVAVIDDDAVTRETLKLMLSTLGYGAELYDSAETFLARLGESAAACLVIDIQLDAVSGIELGRGLAAAGLKLPVIFMTASPDQALRQRAMDAGCVAFLRKPIARPELAEALTAARPL